jgi:RNA polymerase sigma factor (sigma-70 family)
MLSTKHRFHLLNRNEAAHGPSGRAVGINLSGPDTVPLSPQEEHEAFIDFNRLNADYVKALVRNDRAVEILLTRVEWALANPNTFRSIVVVPSSGFMGKLKALALANSATARELLKLNQRDFRALTSKSCCREALRSKLFDTPEQYQRRLCRDISRRRGKIARLIGEIPLQREEIDKAMRRMEQLGAEFKSAIEKKDRRNVIKLTLVVRRSATPFKRYLEQLKNAAELANEKRNYIISRNLKLLAKVASAYGTTQYDADSNFSDGYSALSRSVERFDYTRGAKFSTYSVQAVSRAIFNQRASGSIIKHPSHVAHFNKQAQDLLDATTQEYGRNLSQEESLTAIYNQFKGKKSELLLRVLKKPPVSIDIRIKNRYGESCSRSSIIRDKASDLEQLEESDLRSLQREQLANAIKSASLSSLQRKILNLKHALNPEPLTTSDVAKITRLNVQEVSQHELTGLAFFGVTPNQDGSRTLDRELSMRILAASGDELDRKALSPTTRQVLEILYCFPLGDRGLRDSEIARYLNYTHRHIGVNYQHALDKIAFALRISNQKDLLT